MQFKFVIIIRMQYRLAKCINVSRMNISCALCTQKFWNSETLIYIEVRDNSSCKTVPSNVWQEPFPKSRLCVTLPKRRAWPTLHWRNNNAMASQIISLTIVYSTIYSGADQGRYHSSASLAFVRVIHRWPVNSSHKWPVTWKMFPFDDFNMMMNILYGRLSW